MPKTKITPQEELTVVELYLKGYTIAKIVNTVGHCNKVCSRVLKNHGVKTRNSSSKEYRKIKFQYNIFDTIDTKEKAYWIGFIAADGYVTKNSLGIRLKASDMNHLKKFCKFIDITTKPKFYIGKIKDVEYKCCSIFVSSKELVNTLSKYNIIPNKTKIFFPKNIPNIYLKDFWRGFFDGDGSIGYTTDTKTGRNIKRWVAGVTGNELVVKEFEEYVKSIVNTTTTSKKRKKDNNYDFVISGNNIVTLFISHLYSGSDIYLDRKKELVDECIRQPQIRRDLRDMSSKQLFYLKDKLGTWADVAKHLGMTRGNLYKKRKLLGDSSFQKIGGDERRIIALKDGKILKKYSGANEASLDYNMQPASVRKICRGKNKSTKCGTVFRYEDI